MCVQRSPGHFQTSRFGCRGLSGPWQIVPRSEVPGSGGRAVRIARAFFVAGLTALLVSASFRTAAADSGSEAATLYGYGRNDLRMPDGLKHTRAWQDGRHCGMNALFFFLRLNGKPVPYEELVKEADVDPRKGVNLQMLLELAQKHGVDAEVVQTTPEILETMTEPVILHHEYAVDRGHFEVYLGIDHNEPSRYWAVNTTRCEVKRPTMAWLGRTWSGYLLRRKPVQTPLLFTAQLQSTVMVGLLIILGTQLFLAMRRPSATSTTKGVSSAPDRTAIACQ